MPLAIQHGDGHGGFTTMLPLAPPLDTLTGEVRSIEPIKLANGGKAMLIGFNNGRLRLLGYR